MSADTRLGEIVAALGGELVGDPGLRIDRIGPLLGATPSTLTYLSAQRLVSRLAESAAGCVVVATTLRDAAVARGAAILTPDPYLYYARLSQWWAARTRPAAVVGVHPLASVDLSADIGSGVSIGPYTVVEADAVIGAGAVIGAQCHVGAGARIGPGTRFAPRVTFGHHCTIGARGFVQSGAVIGADGFGFAPTAGLTGADSRWEKIEQFGNVTIGDDVEIGANTCIDRGSFDDTTIADGVKLDNLIQIGHNSRIGAHTLMAGCSAAAGSADIGAHCIIGPGAGVGGHFKVTDRVHVSTMAMVSHAITKPGQYGGKFPIDDQATYTKNAAALRNLHELRTRVRRIEAQLASAAAPPTAAADPTSPEAASARTDTP